MCVIKTESETSFPLMFWASTTMLYFPAGNGDRLNFAVLRFTGSSGISVTFQVVALDEPAVLHQHSLG